MLRAKRQRTNELLVRALWLEINTRGTQFLGPVLREGKTDGDNSRVARSSRHAVIAPISCAPVPWNRTTRLALAALVVLWAGLFSETWASWGNLTVDCGREMYVASEAGVPNRVYRVEIATGRRTLWKELYPAQIAGVRLSEVAVTPDGQTILHTYSRLLSDLYVMDSPSAPVRK